MEFVRVLLEAGADPNDHSPANQHDRRRYRWAMQRDPDGVSAELALDHRFPGLAVVVGEANEGVDRAQLEGWYRDEHLPSVEANRPSPKGR